MKRRSRFLQVPVVCLCDANFGLLESDEEFVEDLVKAREKYGNPRGLESSWAKNKSERFRRIVRTLKQHGFHSSFVLSLQTLSDSALIEMTATFGLILFNQFRFELWLLPWWLTL